MKRPLVRGAALLALVLLSVELGARAAEWMLPPPSAPSPAEQVQFGPDGKELAFEWMSTEVVHPFVGYVRDRGSLGRMNHGLPAEVPPLAPRNERVLRVAVLGGSVAFHVTESIGKAFRKAYDAGRIRAAPRVVRLAYPGFKQPQQLNVLTWFVTLGGGFDLVINVDGYNEVALSAGENYPAKTFPFFPRRWDQRVAHVPNQAHLREIGLVTLLEDVRSRLEPDPPSPFDGLATIRLARRAALRLLRHEIWRARDRLRTLPSDSDFESHGPFQAYRSEDVLFRQIARHWARSSLLMNEVTGAQGGEYHHVLQPNQYVPPAKIFSEDELQNAYLPEHEHARVTALGYPLLQKQGADLRERGVRFHDSTPLFRDVTETLYVDVCCHLNDAGNDLLGAYIVDRILATSDLDALRRR